MAYLTAAEVRDRVRHLPSDITDDEINSLVAEFEEIAEEYRGVAFTPRSHTETVYRPSSSVILTRYPLRSVTSFTVDGDAGTVADLTLDTNLSTIYGGGWFTATPVVVTYSHGLDAPPEVLLRACAEYVRAVAMADRSGQGRDVIAQSFDGGITRYSSPSWSDGRPTGFLEVDRLLNSLPDYRIGGVA